MGVLGRNRDNTGVFLIGAQRLGSMDSEEGKVVRCPVTIDGESSNDMLEAIEMEEYIAF